MKNPKFQTPTGTHDLLPEIQKYFKKIYEKAEEMADFYEFGKIETPILENLELFVRGVGENTDIVGKEMYTLRTKGGDALALRPEGTAPIARAYISNGMQNIPQPVKLWYFGPFFRYEHPQAGRYRQFWQFGFEILGEASAVVDAQIIQMFYNVLRELKLKDLKVEVNSIGCPQCRAYYKKLLKSYFRNREGLLCADCKRRVKENPLRVLDCKEEKCQPVKSQAPQTMDHLCEECYKHFKEVLEFLEELEIPYNLNPYLVRGLDYYTKTVFEIVETGEDGKKIGSLAGGGRYDNLIKILGGKPVPGCGAAAGVDRIASIMKAREIKPESEFQSDVFLAQLGTLAKRKSLKLLEEFRKAKIKVSESFGRDSLKAQLARANKIGAKFTLILGQREALEGKVIVRNMENGKQDTVKTEDAVEQIKKMLKG